MNSVEKGTVLHCLKSMIDEEVCEECPLYGTTGTDHCEKDCVRLAINALEQEPREDVCEWFEQSIDIVTDDVKFRFSDGTVKRAKLGLYMCDIEKSLRKMLIDQIANEKKQEPCADCISRQAVLNIIEREQFKGDALSEIEKLPPVTPAEKVGQWITLKDEDGDVCEAICSNCNKNGYHKWVSCPYCGAKMQEVSRNEAD